MAGIVTADLETFQHIKSEIIKLRQRIAKQDAADVNVNQPSLYYCKSPTGGIPAATESGGVITTGKARCFVYNLRDGKIKLSDKIKIGVHNRHKTVIFEADDFIAVQDGFGNFCVGPDWYNQIRYAKATEAITSGSSGTADIYVDASTQAPGSEEVTAYHVWCHSNLDLANTDKMRLYYDRHQERWDVIDRECP